jgi:ATP-binding cassette subfamily B protein
VVFDGATSALDTKTEREIQASLADLRRRDPRHRPPIVDDRRRRRDLMLDGGRIVERGDHRDLLPVAASMRMWARQRRRRTGDRLAAD